MTRMDLSVGVAERPLHGEDRALVVPGIGLFGVFDGLAAKVVALRPLSSPA